MRFNVRARTAARRAAIHARVALHSGTCGRTRTAARFNTVPVSGTGRAGVDADASAPLMLFAITEPFAAVNTAVEPALIRAIAPVVPAVDATPAQAASMRKSATIPAGAVPAVKIEAETVALVHIDAHGDLIDK